MELLLTKYNYWIYAMIMMVGLYAMLAKNNLIKKIIDPDPFEEIYDCGNRNQFKSIEKDLNKLIHRKFKGCDSLLQ